MRLKLYFTKNTVPVPFDYKELVTGTIYKWLGDKCDEFHGRKYQKLTISDLYGSKYVNGALEFDKGGYIYVSSSDSELFVNLCMGIQINPLMFNGLTVTKMEIVKEPNFKKVFNFKTLSMLFVKDEDNKFIYPDNPNFSEILKRKINNSLVYHGEKEDPTIKITFFEDYSVKKYRYKGIDNKGVIGRFILLAKPETKKFLYDNGIGSSTGIGFGCFE